MSRMKIIRSVWISRLRVLHDEETETERENDEIERFSLGESLDVTVVPVIAAVTGLMLSASCYD